MTDFDWSKVLFRVIGAAGVVGAAFAFGLHSGAHRTGIYQRVHNTVARIEEAFELVVREAPTLTRTRPDWYLQPAGHAGKGVTVNAVDDGSLVLLAGFFEDETKILLMERDGSIRASWPVHYSEIFPDSSHVRTPPATDWNVDIHGSLVNPDGSVVFNFEQAGLVKLDRCGKVAWTVARETHHSVEAAESGGYWVPSRYYVDKKSERPDYPPFEKPYFEDTVMRVSEDGAILSEFSAVDLFYRNDLVALLTATETHFTPGMEWDHEILHLNKVAELKSGMAGDFPPFAAGDLLLSIRGLNLLLVVDPATLEIKWWRTGPWLRQHDAEFEPGGRISVFDNNTFRAVMGSGANPFDRLPLDAPRVSEIVVADPVSGKVDVVYGNRDGQRMLSVIRGKQQSRPGGGWLVTEHQAGRAFEVDREGRVVWEFVNRYDDDEVAGITEALAYPAGYFAVADWSCRPAKG